MKKWVTYLFMRRLGQCVCLCSGLLLPLIAHAQCTDQTMLTTAGASVQASGTYGICLFCSVSNTSNVTNASTTDFATISIPVGVGGGGYIRLALPTTYPAGTRVGWVADVNGGIAGLFNSVTLRAYLNGTQVGSVSGGSLFNVLGIGGGVNISGVFCSPFNEIRIDMGSLVGVLATYRVYYAYVTSGCSFPVQCGTSSSTEVCGDNIDNDGDGLVDEEDVCVTLCNAGTAAPTLSATTRANVCPSATANLTTITASNLPASTSLTWHTGTPATSANKLTTPQAQAASAGTYYAAFYDATNDCYSNSGSATTAVTVSTSSCFNTTDAPDKSISAGALLSGNASSELSPTLGTAPYVYSVVTGGSCPAISGASAYSGAITMNSSSGAYSLTAPTTTGQYYYCVRVCDSATPTPACSTETYRMTVTASCTGMSQTLLKQ